MKLLLHACCGPCTLEPARILRDEGFDITIGFYNPNIQPYGEYLKRLEVLKDYVQTAGFALVDLPYEQTRWEAQVAPLGFSSHRCRSCYHLRLYELARYAHAEGFEAISTTLSVSPYQHLEFIQEELVRSAERWGLQAVWRDFTPYYDEATQHSRELGMYRQDYCGCRFSVVEATRDRLIQRQLRKHGVVQRYLQDAAFTLQTKL